VFLVSIALFGFAASSRAAALKVLWSRAVFGDGPGIYGIGSYPNGQDVDIVLSGIDSPHTYWQVVRADDPVSLFRTLHVHAHPTSSLRKLLVADVIGDSRAEIVTALASGKVEIFSTAPIRLVGGFQAPFGAYLQDLEVAEMDGFPPVELLISKYDQLRVYWPDGTLRAAVALDHGGPFAVAEMDGDSAPEIAIERSVLDAGTLESEWSFWPYSSRRIEAADIDGDGLAELLASDWSALRSFDVDQRALKWELPIGLGPFGAFLVADVGDDGEVDLLTRSGSGVARRRASDGSLIWQSPGLGMTPVALGVTRLQADGPEIVIDGAGGDGSGPSSLIVLDAETGDPLWSSGYSVGFAGPLIANLEGRRGPSVIVASGATDPVGPEGDLLELDPASGKARAIHSLSPDPNRQTEALAWADLDGDQLSELVVAGQHFYHHGLVAAYRLAADGFELLWESAVSPDWTRFGPVLAADLDRDGHNEIVAAGATSTTSTQPGIYRLDGSTGEMITFDPVDTQPDSLVIVNLDSDPNLELLTLGRGGPVLAVDPTEARSWVYAEGNYTAISTDGDVVLLGDWDGTVTVTRPTRTGPRVVSQFVADSRPIDGLAVQGSSIWTASFGIVRQFSRGGLVATSEFLGYGFGRQLSIVRDGRFRAICGSGPIQTVCLHGPAAR